MYAVHTEVALVGGSDSVGKTNSYCVSKMMTFVVKPAGMWQLNAIVAQLKYRPFAANTATEHLTVAAQLLVGTQSARRR